MTASLPLIGVGSDGQTVEQWDGHRPPIGVMLRWFAPDDAGFPDLGFDVYRANVGDVIPFRFDDAAIADLIGKRQVSVANEVDLETTDPGGLSFQPYGLYNALLVPSGSRLTIAFPGRAWDLYLASAALGADLAVEAFAAGDSRSNQVLGPGQQLTWRTHGIDRLTITGDGAISFLGYRLVNAPYQWVRLAHRSLPVSDAGYPDPARPAVGGEEAEAQSRLPLAAQGDWASTYGAHFPELLATLTALARHEATPPIPAPSSPDDPRLRADGLEALKSALIDPHIGRLVGLAYDDGTAATVSQLLAYKVVGRWYGRLIEARVGDTRLVELALDVAVDTGAGPQPLPLPLRARSITAQLGRAGTLILTLGAPMDQLGAELASQRELELVALDAAGDVVATGTFDGGTDWVTTDGPQFSRLELRGSGTVSIGAFRWREAPFERYGLIPGMSPADPGPPAGPSWLTAKLSAADQSLRMEAELDWETLPPVSPTPELGAIGVQVAGLRSGTDPKVAVPAPAFDRKYLLRDGAVAITPPSVAARPPPRVLLRDAGPASAGLAEGWYHWWARGVDLFGRCSPASPPAGLGVEDTLRPPPPMLVLAEQIQADLPSMTLAVLGRSPLAMAWLNANPAVDALACCVAWTPELARAAPDVDAFKVYVRRPIYSAAGDSRDPTETYDGVAWGAAVDFIGPVATRLTGKVVSAGASVSAITVASVEPEPVLAGEPRRFRLLTDLALDTGSGELVGANLSAGAATFAVVGNGEGTTASVLVTAPAGATAPAPGVYDLAAGTSALLAVQAGVTAPATGNPFKRAYGGTLVVQRAAGGPISEDRHRVLGVRGGALLCVHDGAPAPVIGAVATWYPAWALTIKDTGFGPAAGPALPVAKAQVAATAMRRSTTTQALESVQSTPATVLAIDTTVPTSPTLPEIATLPSDHCAQLATRADWYGISRYTISFTPSAAGTHYVVTRALGDSVFRLDRARRLAGPGYAVDTSAGWMAPLLSGARGQAVAADLAALTAALAAAGQDDTAVELAYAALHVDAARILAAQTWVAPAYVQRHGTPLSAAEIPYVDELEGRSRAHWFYRVAARSAAGIESAPSPPTPPICCPDVTPPSAPVARLALAESRAVKVSWLPVPDPDVDHYLLFRGRDDTEVADPRDLTPIVTVAAASVSGSPIVSTVACPPGEWRFRIVAVDAAGNRSRPSSILAGRALLPPPPAPVWTAAVRDGNHLKLSWTPSGGSAAAGDPRLACLVERRQGGGFWISVSGWLPRAVYEFDDAPPDVSAAWEYRLRVRDELGQVASTLPAISVPAL